ncbi:MAG: lysophospholipid acyltransferase family protein [Acidimicrobiales bacterium]
MSGPPRPGRWSGPARLGQARFPLARPTWPSGVPRPAPVRRVGLAYDHEWSRRYPVRLARAVVMDNLARPLARAVAPVTVRGEEHLRLVEAPVIFAANHASHLDTPLLLTTLPVRFRHHTVVAAASDYFFDTTWKAVLWSFSLAAIPVERSKVNRRSADTAAGLLAEGWNLVIFPEGGRTPDGWVQPFRGGAAYLARRTARPVVPVYLHGTRHVLGRAPDNVPGDAGRPAGGSGSEARGRRGIHRAPVAVMFGAPLTPDDGEDARRFGARVEAAVAALADEVATDWWTARRRAAGADPVATGPAGSAWRRSWALGPRPATAPRRGRRPAPAGGGDGITWPKL